MGAAQLSEFNCKAPPSALPGSYSFLRFASGRHPTTNQPISLFVLKHPHKLINPPCESEFLRLSEVRESESYTVAISNEEAQPLTQLSRGLSSIELRMLLKIMIEKPGQVGRYFFISGKYKLWCEDKRGYECMSPEQVKGGRACENSNVFCSAVAFINFLSFSIEKLSVGFFQPKTKQEYLTSVEQLYITVQTSDFWHVLDPPLRELLKQMLQPHPNDRIHKKQLDNHFYLTDMSVLVYSDLCELWSWKKQRQLQFLRLLQNSLHVLDTHVLKRYVVPILADYLRLKQICHECILCLLEALNRCSLIQTAFFEKVVLQKLVAVLSDNPSAKTVYNLLLKAQYWSNYMSARQFDMYFGAMLLKAYQSGQPQMLKLAVFKTELFFDRLEPQPREKLQAELFSRLITLEDSQFRMMALKCVYTLLKKDKLIDRQKLFGLLEQIRSSYPEVNIHLIRIIGMLAEQASQEELVNTYLRSLGGFMLRATHRSEFDFADALYQWMLSKLREHRHSALKNTSESAIQCGQASDYADESRFLLQKETAEELAIPAPDCPQSDDFGYFRYSQNPPNDRNSIKSDQPSRMDQDESDYKYSEHFGRRSSAHSRN